MHVGEIIHKLRKARKMTLLELSNKSSVALATLSRMENGKMTGTLDSHMRICQALEIALPDLYKDLVESTRKIEVQTQKERAEIFVHDKKAKSEILASNVMSKKMMPAITLIAKGGSTHPEETKPGVEKFIYVLGGKLEANIGQQKYNIMKGDTLYFESAVPHHFKNTGNGDACLITVVAPPTL